MDLIGKRFGLLRVVGNSSREGYVVCWCDCGTFKDIRATSLTKKKDPTRSCGCLQREIVSTVGRTTISSNSKEQVENNRKFRTNFGSISCEKPKNNTSGHKGVSWNKSHGKWQAYIGVHHKCIKLGYFTDIEEAIKARMEAEEKYFKPLIEAKENQNVL